MSNVPEALQYVPLRLSGGSTHLVGNSLAKPGRNIPLLLVDLQIAASTVSGGIGGQHVFLTDLFLEISQFGSTGYVAQASGTLGPAGNITGTLNGRISVYDGRTDPSATWVNCDSAVHHFEIDRIK